MGATYHARKRCEERFDIKLDRQTSDYIIKCMKHGKYKLIEKLSKNGNKRLVQVVVRNIPIKIIYAKRSNVIITVLPNNNGENQNG